MSVGVSNSRGCLCLRRRTIARTEQAVNEHVKDMAAYAADARRILEAAEQGVSLTVGGSEAG